MGYMRVPVAMYMAGPFLKFFIFELFCTLCILDCTKVFWHHADAHMLLNDPKKCCLVAGWTAKWASKLCL